jgi:hypothetical protein
MVIIIQILWIANSTFALLMLISFLIVLIKEAIVNLNTLIDKSSKDGILKDIKQYFNVA